METPPKIRQAVIAILITLAISTLLTLYQKLAGKASNEEFVFSLIIYAFLCILPYKIGNRSNAARYVYLVITIFSILILIGGVNYEKHKLDYTVSMVLIPIEIFIIYCLFQKESSSWFNSKTPSKINLE